MPSALSEAHSAAISSDYTSTHTAALITCLKDLKFLLLSKQRDIESGNAPKCDDKQHQTNSSSSTSFETNLDTMFLPPNYLQSTSLGQRSGITGHYNRGRKSGLTYEHQDENESEEEKGGLDDYKKALEIDRIITAVSNNLEGCYVGVESFGIDREGEGGGEEGVVIGRGLNEAEGAFIESCLKGMKEEEVEEVDIEQDVGVGKKKKKKKKKKKMMMMMKSKSLDDEDEYEEEEEEDPISSFLAYRKTLSALRSETDLYNTIAGDLIGCSNGGGGSVIEAILPKDDFSDEKPSGDDLRGIENVVETIETYLRVVELGVFK